MTNFKYICYIFLLLCALDSALSSINIQQLDFLNVGRYIRAGRNLLVGDPNFTKTMDMPFDPHQSDRLTGSFQKTYGFRGENLIHALGAGYSISQLKSFGAA